MNLRLLAVLTVLAALPLSAQITIAPDAVSARVTPYATTAWMALAWEDRPPGRRILLTDIDGDGIVGREKYVPSAAGIWCVVDMTTRAIHVTRGDGRPPATLPFQARFLRDDSGRHGWINLPYRAKNLNLMLVRPGTGAWYYYVNDGMADENPQAANAMIHVSRMGRHPGAPPAPSSVEKGDVLIGFEVGTSLDQELFFGGVVDEWLDAAATHESRVGFATSAWVNESDGVARIQLARTGSNHRRSSITYTLTDGTAKAGVHYGATTGTVTFEPGEIFKTAEVPLLDDSTYWGDTSFSVSLAPLHDAVIDERSNEIFQIVDDDKPTLTIGSLHIQEGDGEREIAIPVTLTGDARVPTTLNWLVRLRGAPGVVRSGTLLFAPGQTAGIIPLTYDGNTRPNPDLRFEVLSNLLNDPAVTPGLVIVRDDDAAPLSVPELMQVREDAGSVLLPVTLAAAQTQPVTVTFHLEAGNTSSADATLTPPYTVTFAPGTTAAMVPVDIRQDRLMEGNEWFGIRVVASGLVVRETIIEIIDDDVVPVVALFSLVPAPAENDKTYTVILDGPGSDQLPAMVTVRTVDGTAKAGTDYVPFERLLIVNSGIAGWTIPVQFIDDRNAEPSETFMIEAVFGPSATVIARYEVVIHDDDAGRAPLPELTIGDVTAAEDGFSATFEVVLSTPSAAAVTFRADTLAGTAAGGKDFASFHSPITLAPGETRVTLRVPLIDDEESEGQETFSMLLSAVTNATLAREEAKARITDDDGGSGTTGRRRSARH